MGDFSPFWAVVFFGKFFWKNTEVARKIGSTFSTVKVVHSFSQRVGWATPWASFNRARLVALAAVRRSIERRPRQP
jgi:hypothetical protein